MIFKSISDPDHLIIITFGEFATHTKICVQSRVLKDESINENLNHSFTKNVVYSFKCF